VRVNDAAREHGQIARSTAPTYDLPKNLPTVVLRNEDYGRITRILADGTPVTLEFTSEPDVPARQDVVQRDCRDSRQRQGGRSRDARRPPRLVALRDGRHGQRDWLRRHDGSRAHLRRLA
jgi:hypothetical protein